MGRQGGFQGISLGKGCVHFGIVLHELMHSLGFWHEQSRADRDDYIQIVWSNIRKGITLLGCIHPSYKNINFNISRDTSFFLGMDHNFKKYTWKYIQNLGENYDLYSVMHYGPFVFAADRSRPTIIAGGNATSGKVEMGQRVGFSPVDLRKINKLYKCNRSKKSKTATVRLGGTPFQSTQQKSKTSKCLFSVINYR